MHSVLCTVTQCTVISGHHWFLFSLYLFSRLVLGSRQWGQHFHLCGVAAPAAVRQLGPQFTGLQTFCQHPEKVAHEPRPQTQCRLFCKRRSSGPEAWRETSASAKPQPEPRAWQPPDAWRDPHRSTCDPQRTGEKQQSKQLWCVVFPVPSQKGITKDMHDSASKFCFPHLEMKHLLSKLRDLNYTQIISWQELVLR